MEITKSGTLEQTSRWEPAR